MLTPERLDPLVNKEFQDLYGRTIQISLLGEFKMREDSPDLTKLYDVLLDGKSLTSEYSNNQMFEIVRDGNRIDMRPFRPWKKYVIEVND